MAEQKEKKLTHKEQRFIEEFTVDFSAAQAAIRSDYSKRTAKVIGYQNLNKAHIQSAINERLKRLSMSAEEAAKRLTDWGRGSFEPFTKEDPDFGVVLDLSTPEARESLHLIRRMKQTKREMTSGGDTVGFEYVTEVELHDAKDAVIQIAKIHGQFVARLDHTSGGKPLNGISAIEVVYTDKKELKDEDSGDAGIPQA
jgi:phage terminase small subunit